MLKQGLLTIPVLTACLLSTYGNTVVADEALLLNDSTLDVITGAGQSATVTVTASGSGNSSGRTQVQGASGFLSNLPFGYAIATGSAVASGNTTVITTANANATVTNPGRFSFHASVDQTVSGQGISISFGTGIAINAF